MARYIEIEEKQIKQLKREAQQFQDDIVCAVGTDFMQKIASAENKMIFDILKGLVNEPPADVVPRAEVEELKKKLNDYKKFVGEIRVTSENHAVIIDTEHTEYIDKRVAEGLKNLAVKQAKQEAYKEVFEEIEEYISTMVAFSTKELNSYDGLNMPQIIIPFCKGEISALWGISDFIAELKKKYIGE